MNLIQLLLKSSKSNADMSENFESHQIRALPALTKPKSEFKRQIFLKVMMHILQGFLAMLILDLTK